MNNFVKRLTRQYVHFNTLFGIRASSIQSCCCCFDKQLTKKNKRLETKDV